MVQRSRRQKDIDDRAFPIRVKVKVPPNGLSIEMSRIMAWLRDEIGWHDCAQHPAPAIDGNAIGFHFRRIEDAARFLDAFPLLQLADDTTSRAYTSPVLPGGRRG
jgi:hypothetical protein